MGDIFKREIPEQAMPFTGERLTSAIGGQIEWEHFHRYLLAREFARDRDVLDVACGEGYGTAYLAQVARHVVGVDVGPGAVEHALAQYQRPNVEFRVGNATGIPVETSSIDLVVSFETLEHFYDHDRFLEEVKRVLRPDGLFLISTPDRDIYSPPGTASNPFHVYELTRTEFSELIGRHFSRHAMLVQRAITGSVMCPETPGGARTIERRGDDHFEASRGLAGAPYRVALAANGTLPDIGPSFYFDRPVIDREADIAALNRELAQARSENEAQRDASARAPELEKVLRERNADIDWLKVQLDTAKAEGEVLKGVAARVAILEGALRDRDADIARFGRQLQAAAAENQALRESRHTLELEIMRFTASMGAPQGRPAVQERKAQEGSGDAGTSGDPIEALKEMGSVLSEQLQALGSDAESRRAESRWLGEEILRLAAWIDSPDAGEGAEPATLPEGMQEEAFPPGLMQSLQTVVQAAIPRNRAPDQATADEQLAARLPGLEDVAFLSLPDPASASPDGWSRHIPFIRWVTGATAPRLVADLGVPAGASTRAFRESIAHWGLAARCIGGPESAAGTPEAGMTAGSVDLLHLRGGFHSVRELFAAWRPFLSPRAVLLLHGIDCRDGRLDTLALWNEIRSQHPHLAFTHGGGLGVAALGPEPPVAVLRLLDLDYGAQEGVLSLFADLGARTERPDGGAGAAPALDEAHTDAEKRWRDQIGALAKQLRETTERAERLDRHAVEMERAHGTERERAERAEQDLRHLLESSAWRIARALRHPKTLIGLKKTLPPLLPPPPALLPPEATPPAAPEVHLASEAKARLRLRCQEDLRHFMLGSERIALPTTAERPEISIVILLWNQAALSLACLRSLSAAAGLGIEVVLVDNGSTDETAQLLERVDGAVVLRNADNAGYVMAVNQGVAASRGVRVLLLNNDAMLRPGSLDAALETLESAPDIGAVGGPIVLPDGLLQEAGSIIWSDGSCLGYGRGREPGRPEFKFRRDVDFCSAAFLLLWRDTWNLLDGFDPVFSPAYYEETDFCMRLRQKGLRVVYEPRAVIDHLEFGSSEGSSWTELQARNAAIFRERHAAALSASHPRHGTALVEARMRQRDKRRILVIDDRVPHPDLGSGFPRAATMVRALAESSWEVTFLPLQFPQDDWELVYRTLPPTVEVMLGVGEAGLAAFIAERQGYYDALLVSRPHNMAALRRLRESLPDCLGGALVVYDAEALFSARELVRARLLGQSIPEDQARARVQAEVALSLDADRILAVSEDEARHFRSQGQAPVFVLPHLIEPRPTPRAWQKRNGLLFVGRLAEIDSPNFDSICWFCDEVLPLLQADGSEAEMLFVAGQTDAMANRSWPGVRMLGKVADLWPLYDHCRIFIAPTRFAAGIPHKVHEAAAHGVPVVATSLLAEQLGWRHEHELLVADEPQDFADGILRLRREPALWNRLRTAALERIARDCSRRKFVQTLERALDASPRTASPSIEAA